MSATVGGQNDEQVRSEPIRTFTLLVRPMALARDVTNEDPSDEILEAAIGGELSAG